MLQVVSESVWLGSNVQMFGGMFRIGFGRIVAWFLSS